MAAPEAHLPQGKISLYAQAGTVLSVILLDWTARATSTSFLLGEEVQFFQVRLLRQPGREGTEDRHLAALAQVLVERGVRQERCC